MTWSVRVAVLEDASVLPQLEFSAGRRFLAIADLAWLATEEDISVEAHRRYIAHGTEWVAMTETALWR